MHINGNVKKVFNYSLPGEFVEFAFGVIVVVPFAVIVVVPFSVIEVD